MMKEEIELSFEYPSLLADQLKNDEIDIGLIPVAAISSLEESHIITDVCIGASGPVASVCLFSDVPIEEIKFVYLDYQSKTSVALLKVLLQEYWKLQPEFLQAFPDYQQNIRGTTAGLVIGDRAFAMRKKCKYIYDLAECWIEMTGLPFVFAAWVANKKLEKEFINQFTQSSAEGLNHIAEIATANINVDYDLQTYYSRNIDYVLDEKKREGLELFLNKLKQY